MSLKQNKREQTGGEDNPTPVKLVKATSNSCHSTSSADDTHNIPGLRVYEDFITKEEEEYLLKHIDAETWDTTLKRRVQQYGFKYDYSSKAIDKDTKIDPLPSFADCVVSRTVDSEIFPNPPDQCIINEYVPGQGINAHIDKVDHFGPVVVSLSLGSAVIMTFTYESRSVDVLLPRRSLAVLSGDARYKWKHAIVARKSDNWNGSTLQRERRVSMTFRTVKL